MEILTLKKRKDFVRVANKGLRVVTSTVILQAAQNLSPEQQNVFVGYTTTKKIGKAHVRNRARRRLRAAVREIFPQSAQMNNTYVLIGRYNTADCPYKDLCQDLKWGLKKLAKLSLKEEKNNTNTEKLAASTSEISSDNPD